MSTTLREVSLEDKYRLAEGRVYMTGVQALVRLPLEQRRRDQETGLDTAGYVTGYRGSPLGTYDQQLGQARKLLAEHGVRFQPAVNEELAATAIAGSQQAELDGEGRHAGVFAIWYGKGPGVDRSGDAFRHGNLAGSSQHGGVLLLLGDDHLCESSTTAHQSEYAMVDAMIPTLNPASVQEILEYGLLGIAMSRHSGAWVALKCVHDTVESAASVDLRDRAIRLPDIGLPEGGLNIRWPDTPLEQEARLHLHKLNAARDFARANGIDRVTLDCAAPRLAVVTTGKSYLDVRQALDLLELDDAAASAAGLRLLKIGMPFPLDGQAALEALAGVPRALVVEEKRGLIEEQLKSALHGRAGAALVEGKADADGAPLLPAHGALSPERIAIAIGRRLAAAAPDPALAARVAALEAHAAAAARAPAPLTRLPYFCAGCPHNSSTTLPAGSKARAGIGCHYMAQWMDRETARFTQMGGEGAAWMGEAPFSKRPHMFQNLGDGTYYHSGLLAIRAAVAAKTNITYKLLFNDATAMTGGQRHDGGLTPAQLTRQLSAEGVGQIALVSDEPEGYRAAADLAAGVSIHHRSELDAVQQRMREVPGVTAIVYAQTCAAEKRRRRKKREMPDPPRRAFINERVCEGCGDCGLKSNCVAILPLETELGRKRAIDQSSCNKDFSCVEGFCPSFVTVEGAKLRKPAALPPPAAALPEPRLPALDRPYGMVIGGVGGTGVITIGALLGMAAHLEGRGIASLDMTGMAQKGGAVLTHLRIAATQDALGSTRVAAGGAALLLGCDLVVAAGGEMLEAAQAGTTRAVVNAEPVMTGDFTRNADFVYPGRALERRVQEAVSPDGASFVAASRLATRLLGDAIAANLFLVGVAWQQGLIPLGEAAILRAIELNGQAVAFNKDAFAWGRAHAHAPEAVEAAIPAADAPPPRTLDERIELRAAMLTEYQDARYAAAYRDVVARVRAAEAPLGREALTAAVAQGLAKLMAYKDEYEVARLYADGAFRKRLEEVFEPGFTLAFHLAPPLLPGPPRKRRFGAWTERAFGLLARLKRLRGTPFDVFGYMAERREERALIVEYRATVEGLLAGLTAANHAVAVEIATLPDRVRGYGHVKAESIAAMRSRRALLLERFATRAEPAAAAPVPA